MRYLNFVSCFSGLNTAILHGHIQFHAHRTHTHSHTLNWMPFGKCGKKAEMTTKHMREKWRRRKKRESHRNFFGTPKFRRRWMTTALLNLIVDNGTLSTLNTKHSFFKIQNSTEKKRQNQQNEMKMYKMLINNSKSSFRWTESFGSIRSTVG